MSLKQLRGASPLPFCTPSLVGVDGFSGAVLLGVDAALGVDAGLAVVVVFFFSSDIEIRGLRFAENEIERNSVNFILQGLPLKIAASRKIRTRRLVSILNRA